MVMVKGSSSPRYKKYFKVDFKGNYTSNLVLQNSKLKR